MHLPHHDTSWKRPSGYKSGSCSVDHSWRAICTSFLLWCLWPPKCYFSGSNEWSLIMCDLPSKQCRHTQHISDTSCCSHLITWELPQFPSYCFIIFQFDDEPLEHVKICMAVDHTQNLQTVYVTLFMHEQLQVGWLNFFFFDNSNVLESVVVEFILRNLLFTYRIEQPNMCSVDRLLTSLQLCPVIERVCVISIGGKLSLESVLVDFVCGSSKLVFLYVQLGTLSQAACKRMQSRISARYVPEWNLCIN